MGNLHFVAERFQKHPERLGAVAAGTREHNPDRLFPQRGAE
jgi:hypothetical protein